MLARRWGIIVIDIVILLVNVEILRHVVDLV